jgi:hypothetical protein
MTGKILAIGANAGLAFLAWWMMQPDDERRRNQAGLWRGLEKLSMRVAKETSNLAAYAERRYRETVTI